MQQLPYFYANLKKNIDIDKTRIISECQHYINESLEVGNHISFKEKYANDIDVTYVNDFGRVTKGTVPGYKVISLTYTPEIKNSIWGFNFLRKNMSNHNWIWRDGLEYTKYIIDSMPFKNYYIVKLLFLPENGHGVIHTDCNEFLSHSISLELKNANCNLKIYHNNKTFEINSDYFIFDDTVLHGAGSVSADRLLLRIHGELDLEKLEDHIDKDSIIYFEDNEWQS